MARIGEMLRSQMMPQRRRRRTPLPGDLAVVTCHWNPAGWQSLRRNYLRFLHEMKWWNIPTFAVEVAYDGQDFASDDAWIQVRGNDRNVIWQKERLINLAAERLPERFDKVAWIDADILLLDPQWESRLRNELELSPVVQLWNRWHCADRLGRVGEILECVGDLSQRYIRGELCSPGGAWAARREVFPLYDRHIVGSGDAMCMEAWVGMDKSRCLRRCTPAMAEDFSAWGEAAHAKVQGDIACLPGDAVHLYHGTRADRQYVDRWQPVIDAGFDPREHVEVDSSGLLAWTDAAPPELVEWVRGYFASRNEDG